MILTVLKTTYKKGKPKEIVYRSFKNYDKNVVSIKLSDKLIDCHNYNEFKDGCLQILYTHAPLKKRLVRANEVPYMTKTLRKAIANRSRLENQYYKNKSGESLRAYKKQKNFCSRLYKKERKRYYTNLDSKGITDSKKFWKTIKPFFSEKGANKNDITLIEGDKIFQEDSEVARIFIDFFRDAVNNLNVSVPKEHIHEASVLCDPIDGIISKYQHHPSIKLIKDNVRKGEFSFILVCQNDIEKEIVALDGKKSSMSSSILPKFLKENI